MVLALYKVISHGFVPLIQGSWKQKEREDWSMESTWAKDCSIHSTVLVSKLCQRSYKSRVLIIFDAICLVPMQDRLFVSVQTSE